MNIALFTSTGRIQSLAAGLATAQHPEHDWHRLILDTSDRQAEFEAGGIRPDLILSFLNPYLVPAAYLEAAAGRAYNVHPGPPTHPGQMPFHFAAYDGSWTAGATLHQMTAKADSGEIIDVLEARVDPGEGIRRLVELSKELALALFLKRLPALLADDVTPNGRVWSTENLSTAADFERMSRIDPDIEPAELARRIEAFSSPEHRTPFVEVHGRRFVYEHDGVPGPTDAAEAGVSAAEVRSFILARFEEPIRSMGLTPDEIPDHFDLHEAGVIDSFGLVELITELEARFALEIDFEELDPEDLTIIGPFSRYVESRSTAA